MIDMEIVRDEVKALMYAQVVSGLLASGHYTMREQYIQTESHHCKAMIDAGDIVAEILDDIVEQQIPCDVAVQREENTRNE
jgi:hypothetical protein